MIKWPNEHMNMALLCRWLLLLFFFGLNIESVVIVTKMRHQTCREMALLRMQKMIFGSYIYYKSNDAQLRHLKF